LAATSYAYELLTKSKLQPSGKGGENLFEITGSNEPYTTIVGRALERWYKVISYIPNIQIFHDSDLTKICTYRPLMSITGTLHPPHLFLK
jgi:hypothetical protein